MPGSHLVATLAAAATSFAATTVLWVDSGTRAPAIDAEPTLRGYTGGPATSADVPPSVILSISTQA